MQKSLASFVSWKRHRNAYVLIACIASLLAVAAAAECHAAVLSSRAAAPLLPSLLYGVALWWWWGFVACGLWITLNASPGASILSPRFFLGHALAGSIVCIAHAYLLQATIARDLHSWPDLKRAGYADLHYINPAHLTLELLLYGFLLGACLASYLYLRTQENTLRTAAMEKALSAAHLRALQMQVDPHFLFNTLNAVTALVEFDRKNEALATLANLNALMRTTLAASSPEKVPLGKELQMIENYLAIEQVRFADRLQAHIRIAPDALQGLVPCFLFQPLVENAIRHGIAHRECDGVIEASAQREGTQLHLRVRDNGSGRSTPRPHSGHGIGLKNTRERLAHFYRENYFLSAETLADGGFEVLIRIPFETAL